MATNAKASQEFVKIKEVRDGIKLTPARTYDDIYPSALVPEAPAA